MGYGITKKDKNKIFIVCANILFIGLSVYVIFMIIGSEHIETERADIEVRRDIINFTAYIFRDEEPIYNISGGTGAVYLVENGEKVAKNQAVAQINSVMQASSADLLKTEIGVLENKIDLLKKSNINLEYTVMNIEKINKDLNDLYVETLKNINSNNIKDAGRIRDEKLILMNKRQLISGDAESFNGIIDTYTEKKTELELSASTNTAAGNSTEIYSARSGVFYRRPDGYEHYFTGEAVKTLDPEKFEELIKKEPENDIINRAVGKLAYNYNWFFVCGTTETELAGTTLKEGQSYDIICPYSSNAVIPFVLQKCIDDPDSETLLFIFEANISPDDFNFLRRQTIQIISREIRGIKVPDRAVVVRELITEFEEDEDGIPREITRIIEEPEISGSEIVLGETVKGVYILKGSEVIFRILDDRDKLVQFDNYTLYAEPQARAEGSKTTLQPFEDVLVEGKNLYTGKVVN